MTAPAQVPKEVTFEQQVAARREQLIARPPMHLMNERGHPIPSPDVVKRLPAGASIKWVPAAGFYGTAYFGLFKAWEPNDKRWERVRAGEYPEQDARDLVQMFPPECSPAEMAAYVEQRWGMRNTPRDLNAEADKMIAEAMKLRQQAETEAVDRAVDTANQRSERETEHSLRLRAGDGTANLQVTVSKQIGDGPKRLI